ncbi:HAD family hydrolase [Brevibacillus daliensis]|uniref:HAD family hydrolase n=1 Tax=Brevibacillus daliensis TaxID=2892995 RepID=UPI001E512B39|nr:HAD family hydrolase [Brevibacillus daliensis]
MGVSTTIFFDLDGTLLEMNGDEFINNYMLELTKFVGDRFEPKQLVAWIWDATKAVVVSQETDKTNEQVFIERFIEISGANKEEVWPIFDAFYNEIFPTLSYLTLPSPWGKKLVEAAKEQGYRVAVTTNPLFPKNAIYARLEWIGLTAEDFEWVTIYETSHFTKPNPAYYQEVCDELGVQPEEVIMVGNNMQEDMVASKLGMKTFLVTNYLSDKGEPIYEIDQKGTFEELYEAITERTGVFAK